MWGAKFFFLHRRRPDSRRSSNLNCRPAIQGIPADDVIFAPIRRLAYMGDGRPLITDGHQSCTARQAEEEIPRKAVPTTKSGRYGYHDGGG
jgi:hypothetical protein